jgi:glycosyltransferase involved in cell wall biosynthesis
MICCFRSIRWPVIIICLFFCVSQYNCLNVALHAQVFPEDSFKIVGSVITTDGIKEAFVGRHYLENITVFYPSHYEEYFDTSWDVLLIEGWFPSISEFLHLNRNHFPRIIIIFICLDPAFPGLEELILYDFDGIITNSEQLVGFFRKHGIPSYYAMLAANPRLMKPNTDKIKTYPIIFVGAGGHMLEAKPSLHYMLSNAKPYGLRIYGAGWEDVKDFQDHWQGPLPRYDLGSVYAQSSIVLSSIMKAQEDYGMINNRVFEAMSCGSVLLTEHSDVLDKEFGNSILSYTIHSKDITHKIESILHNQSFAWELSLRARNMIVSYHTWQHRILEIENFLGNILHYPQYSKPPSFSVQRKVMKVLWIVSSEVQMTIDYIAVVHRSLRQFLISHHHAEILEISSRDWLNQVSIMKNNRAEKTFLHEYETIVLICIPFDELDLSMISLPFPILVNNSIQRRLAFYLGINHDFYRNCLNIYGAVNCHETTRYDAIFFRFLEEEQWLRSHYQFHVHPNRIQHIYGISSNIYLSSFSGFPAPFAKQYVLFVCSFEFRFLCTISARQYVLEATQQQFQMTELKAYLLLHGRKLKDWIDAKIVVDVHDLDSISHLEDGYLFEPSIISIIANAMKVYFFLPASGNLLGSIDSTSTMYATIEGQSNVGKNILSLNTVQYPLYFFVVSALTNRSIHISDANQFYLSLASNNVRNWDSLYLEDALKNGFDRLFGLPPARSTVMFRPLSLQLNYTAGNFDPIIDDVNHSRILNNKVLFKVVSNLSTSFALLYVYYPDFQVGRDGLLCINRKNYSSNYQLCLLRSMNYILIVDNSSDSASEQQFSFKLSFRGTVFGDAIIEQFGIIPVQSPNPLPSKKLNSKKIRDSISSNAIIFYYP